MPPRIQPHRVSIPSSCQCFRTRPQPPPECLITPPQIRHAHAAGFGNTKMTKLRRDMMEWLNGPGKAFRDPLPASTNYMSAYDRYGNLIRAQPSRRDRDDPKDIEETEENVEPLEKEPEILEREIAEGIDEEERAERFRARQAARSRQADAHARSSIPRERPGDLRPYPLNHNFRSQPVLSEELREAIYVQVVQRGVDVSTVSAAFSIDTRRVAAVVRLKTIEKKWLEEGKPLAKPYNDAVMAMLPQTPFRPDAPTEKITPHESINDLPVHPYTRQQLFWPTSESRQFTREDAAKAFNEHLLPADKRIAHPELIQLEKDQIEGIDRAERWARQQERDLQAKKEKEAADERRRKWEANTQRIVPGRRWDFKFQDISAEKTGKDGRARNAVGVRYGMPHEDRKRGMVKIPTSVE